MDAYTNILFVVVFQLFIYLVLSYFSKLNLRICILVFFFCALLGVIFGLIFDIAFGFRHSIYSYTTPYSMVFFLINSSLSYGIALGSAWNIPIKLNNHNSSILRRLSIVSLIICIIIVIMYTRESKLSAHVLYINGILIITISENISAILGKNGPILDFIKGNVKPFFVLYIYSILIGILYELINFIFPTWIWHVPSAFSPLMHKIQIIFLGYFVLFHPALIIVKIILPKKIFLHLK